uniref:RRP15-like protein n=1 Tax=Amphiprion percula TaxID=161767 RepID=A0A3P8S4P9_AMPPE
MELVETHVQLAAEDPAEDADPQSEDQSDSEGGSLDGRSDDGDDDAQSDVEKEEEDETGGDTNTNAGWAEVMAKILGKKTSESQSSILVKNKDLDKQKAKERQEQLERRKQDDKKRTWEMMFREKPDVVKDRDAERALQRIATRGVVQLFNAVRKHQKTVDDKVKEAGGSERKKAKVLSSVSKKDFIDVLRRSEGGGRSSDRTQNQAAAAAEEKPAWSVLREDFMMEATMKDWDKDSDQEEAGPPAGGEQGSDSD